MGKQPSKEEEERRLDATSDISVLILQEARRRGRDDLVGALKQVSNEVSTQVMELMATISRSERETAVAAGKEVI